MSPGRISSHQQERLLSNLNNISAGARLNQASGIDMGDLANTYQWLNNSQNLSEIRQLSREIDPQEALAQQYLAGEYAFRGSIWKQISNAVLNNVGLGMALSGLSNAYSDVMTYIADLQRIFSQKIPASIQMLISNAGGLLDTIAGFVERVLPKEVTIGRREIHVLLGGDPDKISKPAVFSQFSVGSPMRSIVNGQPGQPITDGQGDGLGQVKLTADDNGSGLTKSQLQLSGAAALGQGASRIMMRIRGLIFKAQQSPQGADKILAEAGELLNQASALVDFMRTASAAGTPALGAEIDELRKQLDTFVPREQPFRS